MSYAFLSIAALIGAILIGIKRKVNIGIVAMFFAFVLSRFVFEGIDVNKLILKGWPLKIFFIMMSAMFLFSFATINGATKLLANKLAYICRNYVKLLPWVFMLATGLLTLCGADPTVIVFMLPIAMLAGQRSRINPIIFCIMLLGAADIGAGSPFSVIGIVTSGLAETAGVHTYLPIWGAMQCSCFSRVQSLILSLAVTRLRLQMGSWSSKSRSPLIKSRKSRWLSSVWCSCSY